MHVEVGWELTHIYSHPAPMKWEWSCLHVFTGTIALHPPGSVEGCAAFDGAGSRDKPVESMWLLVPGSE